ncbi:hypothetical protein Vadar_019095 [Vaccinium darrowii]|uniref:Uncharacterized protein n=1 Tax=Vaccinium darrowii TaxID=229202 RepID=A0ACB7YX00_9ERIC|nr:hypothetical protein Vadar_019095 [Vaccinium darrowii]
MVRYRNCILRRNHSKPQPHRPNQEAKNPSLSNQHNESNEGSEVVTEKQNEDGLIRHTTYLAEAVLSYEPIAVRAGNTNTELLRILVVLVGIVRMETRSWMRWLMNQEEREGNMRMNQAYLEKENKSQVSRCRVPQIVRLLVMAFAGENMGRNL